MNVRPSVLVAGPTTNHLRPGAEALLFADALAARTPVQKLVPRPRSRPLSSSGA